MITFFKLWIVTTLLTRDDLAFDSFRNGRPTFDVSQENRRACEYIFSIDTVSLRSDVRKNMAARPVRA